MPKAAKRPTKKAVKKTAAKPLPAKIESGPRRVKLPPYRPIRLRKSIKPVRPPLPGAFRLLWRSVGMIKRHWKVFLGIFLIYGILNIMFVRGLGGSANLSSSKSFLDNVFKGPSAKASVGLTLFVSLLSGSGSSSANADAGVYQALLVIIISLATIWSLRRLYNNEKVRIRDGFYRGMYPGVPFLLVLLVIGLQLLPLLIGASVYSVVIRNGIAVHFYEKLLWGGLFFVLAVISLYMVCSSLFALYIVTLPDMTPMKALRSARQLVRYRRLVVLRKIVFLPVALLLLAAAIVIPVSLTITPAAEWVYLVFTLLGLIIVHSYMYALYRELLT